MMARLGMFESAVSAKKPTKCGKCGYSALYWQKHNGSWRLHHWTVPEAGGDPRLVLHHCGFDSWGRPKA